jgi:YHS domain-containing protein
MKQAVKEIPKHSSVHQGRTYHFANAQAKQMFDNTPAKYLPAYDGICATGVAMGMKLQSDPKLFVVHGGETYLSRTRRPRGCSRKTPPASSRRPTPTGRR